MNAEEIKQLEDELWGAADDLRANSKLTAAEYKDPVLGLILLRYAQNRYEEAKVTIEASIPDGPRGKRAATKADFLGAGAMMLPENAQYEFLANLPESEDVNEAVNEAMRSIEVDYTDLAGILPKNYQELDSDLLRELIRVFNKDSVKKLSGDVFGRIYEYFLMKFSMSGAGAQEGGEFFTPPSLVNLIVSFIEPDHGIIHDPACGSGGMFVQTGHFIQDHSKKQVNEAITAYGTELKSNNTRLAKMNLAIHGIEGKIIESNSFYSDPHDLVGKCDFVMANPPFNVNKVDKKKDFVKTDKRLFEDVGLPKADNGNYLWIQYFYHYLNAQGRAGFVMASSATDAGASEKLIRQKLIETGDVDCIVAIGNNFFYTKPLPCHLWFLDKGTRPENKDKILMIDARNTFHQVHQTLRDFSPNQMEGLTTLIKFYRGEDMFEQLGNNEWLKEKFPNGEYEDIEGLCKITSLDEIEANDWSLTPGRYVGYSIQIDEDFDHDGRLGEIHSELATLNDEANDLMQQILRGVA
jgi:type I restriction enzyme M protein